MILTWELYIPSALAGAGAVACIVGANKLGSRRAAALTAAYSLTDKAFTEYREKVVEQFGTNKEKAVREQLAQDHVTKNPPEKAVIVSGPANVLCCELYTGRYFSCSVENLRQAQNELNAYLLKHDHATLNGFYDMIGLDHTSNGWDIGWSSEKLMELDFSTVLHKDTPCITFKYNYTRPLI
jgi:hypothetical protein